MSDVLSFYFDGALVQAVKVRTAGNSVTIKEAATFPFDELDDYLSACREKSCIVCGNPQLFYQDIVHLPPAAAKLYDKLVRSEVQNTHPDLTSFSIFHRTVGEATIDTRQFSKIAVFSYQDAFLADFIAAASRHGMAISHAFAAPCSIFRLALSTCSDDPDKPRIFIASLPGEKLILVSENNELEFIRKIPSHESALLPEDTNNINMTIDYCFQSLRIRPVEVVMLNQSELAVDFCPLVSIPYRSSLPPQLDNQLHHIIQDYLAPIAAALNAVEAPRSGNILPSEYAAFSTQKRVLAAAAMLMFFLTLLLGGYLVKEGMAISGLKSKIGRIRTELSGSANELATFRKLDAEVNQLKEPLEFVSKHNVSLNPAAALAALKLPEPRSYTINGIIVQSGEKLLNVQIDGTINAAGYSDTQASFEKLVAQVAQLPGYTVASSSIDIKQRSFSIQARFNGGKQQGK